MKQSDKLKIEMSKARERLAVLSGKDDATEEERKEMTGLTASYAALEERYQAAIVAEAEEDRQAAAAGDLHSDGEARELAAIEARSSMVPFVDAAVRGVEIREGAERELLEAREIPIMGAGGAVNFPLSLLAPEVEERADAVSALTNVDTVTRPQPWLTRLFAGGFSQGIYTRRSVPPGVTSLPYLSAGPAGDHASPGDAVEAEAVTVTAETEDPARVSTRYILRVEDLTRIPMLDSMVRADARMALTTRMEYALWNGDAPVTGITSLTPLLDDGASADAAQTTATTAAKFMKLIDGGVDGKHAMKASDFCIVGPPELSHFMETEIITVLDRATGQRLGERLDERQIEVRMTDHISAVTGNQYYCLFARKRGIAGAAVHSVWSTGSIIRDPYSGASKGEVAVTFIALHNATILRSDNFLLRRITVE